jgi:hypothetical protein
MPDREKVMGWLEGLAEPDWRECYSDSEVQETARQALDLIDELLKEQEPTTFNPHYIDEYGTHFICGVECGSCNEKISRTYHYCPYCGKAVKWE